MSEDFEPVNYERYPEMEDSVVVESTAAAIDLLKRREVNVWRRIFVGIGIIREAIMETGTPVPIVNAVLGVLESIHPRETGVALREMHARVFGMKRKGDR